MCFQAGSEVPVSTSHSLAVTTWPQEQRRLQPFLVSQSTPEVRSWWCQIQAGAAASLRALHSLILQAFVCRIPLSHGMLSVVSVQASGSGLRFVVSFALWVCNRQWVCPFVRSTVSKSQSTSAAEHALFLTQISSPSAAIKDHWFIPPVLTIAPLFNLSEPQSPIASSGFPLYHTCQLLSLEVWQSLPCTPPLSLATPSLTVPDRFSTDPESHSPRCSSLAQHLEPFECRRAAAATLTPFASSHRIAAAAAVQSQHWVWSLSSDSRLWLTWGALSLSVAE